jgi:hypothetical protein
MSSNPPRFGSAALVDNEYGLEMSPEQRLKHSLAEPESPKAITPRKVDRITKSRIQYALAELAHGRIDKVQEWLDRVGEDHPARAIELTIELMKFSVPQLKAIAMEVNDTSGRPLSTYTLAELEALEREANSKHVVSDQ